MKKTFGDYIAHLSVLTIKYYRLTLLWFVIIVTGGFLAYNYFLPKEGFPEIGFPTAIIQIPNAQTTIESVENQISLPIVNFLQELDSVRSINSVSNPNFSLIFISFEQGTNAFEETKIIEQDIMENLTLPVGSFPRFISPKSGTVDGINDLLISVFDENQTLSTLQLQDNAANVASMFEEVEGVAKVSVINLIEEVFNPNLGEPTLEEISFHRGGILNENEDLVFYNSILIGIEKEDDITTSDLSTNVKAKISEIEKSKNTDLSINVVVDFAEGLNNQISSLQSNALSGVIAVAIIVLLLVSWRSSLITAIFIPIVLLVTFLVMLFVGVSINTISLFGLILVLGLLVDDAIVVIEIIDAEKSRGLKGLEAIRVGISKVGKADVLGSMTTVLVFFPMLFITGFLGDIIKDIPITVIITLSVSVFIALFVLPLFINILLVDKKETKKNFLTNIGDFGSSVMNKSANSIANLIRFYSKKWYRMLAVLVVGFVAISVGLYFGSISKVVNFPQEKDSNGININIDYFNGSAVEEREELALEVENLILSEYGDFVKNYSYYVSGRLYSGGFASSALVELTPMGERNITSVEIADRLQSLAPVSTIGVVSIQSDQQAGPPVASYASQIQLYGSNIEALKNASSEISEFILNLELADSDIEVLDVRVANLNSIAKKDGRQFVEIQTNLSDNANDGVIQDISDSVREEFTGDKLVALGLSSDSLDADRGFQSDILKSVQSAGIALGVSFILMYVFLVTTFNSFSRSILIMLAVPFSFLGMFMGLYLTNNPISFFVIIGIIALIGIVVNNTIMLVDFALQEKANGATNVESIATSVKERLRPLLTTSLTTLAGLLPLALAEPLWESLAFTIIFGLLSSTLMVILIFPAYFILMENFRDFLRSRFQ